MAWLKNRFRYAFAGIAGALREDKSIRLQFVFALLAAAAGFALKISRQEWLWILLSVTLVLVSEFFNSCLEKTVDYISLERNPQAGRIKDMAAAAVLLASAFALACALLIFIPPFLAWFN